MRRCLACEKTYENTQINCPACNFGPEMIAGYEAYASSFANQGGGFKAGYFADLARHEEAHFWFRIRNELILWALDKYCRGFQSFLEIGCGTGFVLRGVAERYPTVEMSGSEIFVSGLDFAAERIPRARLMQMDARRVPFKHEFDVIGAFDVIEHIEEDEVVLSQLHNALKPGGHLLLTVPQHAWLWSPTDDYACHRRRYSAADLHRKVGQAGFQLQRSTSFVSTLLPAMMVSRFYQKMFPGKGFDASNEFIISPWLNSLFFCLLSLESGLIKGGLNLPLGGSRLLVAKKIEGIQEQS